ncbi:MAG: efflux RND transporter periplasmic adaptor subunit [Bacteroidales bacterium]|jgi:membrane fusion protein (multidrug efflux system)|nr:efflux RND transporter periplasmic adaptor subunit [Bacteroidales bacterium]
MFVRINQVYTGFVLIMILSLFLTGCKGKKKDPAGGGSLKAVTVGATVIYPRILENKILTNGNLIANEEVELRSEIPGRVISISFEEGSPVVKGALLVKIDDRELQAQLKKLQVDEKQAHDDLYRKEKLLELKAVSQEEYDKSFNTLGIIQAQEELLRTQISKTEIYAPFSGQIGLRQVSPGGFVSSATLVARLQQTNPIKIDFAIPEKYREHVGKGTLIKFSVEGIDSAFTGHVFAIEPKIDPGTRNVSLRASCPNSNGMLIPGAFARVDILLESIRDALVVPSEAIIPQLNGEKVFLCKNGKARSQIIMTGIRTEREVQVVKGLQPGDTVITTAILQLREEMPVNIKEIK